MKFINTSFIFVNFIFLISLLCHFSLAKSKQTVHCDLEGFREKTEISLAKHIQNMSTDCLEELFSSASIEIRTAALRMQNMLYILQAAKEVSQNYNGVDTENTRKYFLFARTGYYNHFHNANSLDWQDGENKNRVDEASNKAVSAFISNSHFLDVSNEHGMALREVLILSGSLEIAPYLPAFKKHLAQFSMKYVNHHYMLSSINAILQNIYNRGLYRSRFVSAVSEDSELVILLTHLSLSDQYLETDAEYIITNAGFALSRLIKYNTAAIYPSVVSGIRSIFNKYDPLGKGASVYIYVLKNILYYQTCDLFSVCNLEKELEHQVLSIRHECIEVPVVIRAQSLNREQLSLACESLLITDNHFHKTLKTNRIPVQNDFNDKLEIIVFSNEDNYTLYSDMFFDNDANDGGIYLEGNPSIKNNTPRMITYIADWINTPIKPIWNLQHEYVHYLDGRFIKYGPYTEGIVGWAEGLSEYISKQNNYPKTIQVYRENIENLLNLSDILQTSYNNQADIIYRWSYLAIRFLFENHPYEIDKFKSYFRNGLYESYNSYIKNHIDIYNDEFKDWLRETFSLVEISTITITRNGGRVALSLQDYGFPENTTVTAHSSNSNKVRIETDSHYIYLYPHLSVGEVEMTLTATIFGKPVETNFTVNVVPGEVLDFEDQTFTQGSDSSTIDLRKYFVISENSVFTVESSNEDVVEPNHYNDYLLAFNTKSVGSALFTVTMQDGTDVFTKTFTVNSVKSPLDITKIGDYGILPVGKTAHLDLSSYYVQSAADNILFDTESADNDIVSAKLQNSVTSVLKLEALSPGETQIRISTTYRNDRYTQWFYITVK